MDVVLFTGLKGSGKDTAAQCLIDRGWVGLAFADPLKSMALAVDPIVEVDAAACEKMSSGSLEKIVGRVMVKVAQGDLSGSYFRLKELVDLVGWEEAKKAADVRRFLQRLGKEGVRDHLGQNTWVDPALVSAVDLVDAGFKVVVKDARFDNECEAFRNLTECLACVYEIQRPGIEPDGHSSEAGVSKHLLDGTIINDGPVEDLHRKVLELVEAG